MMFGDHGSDHARMQLQVERAHGRAERNAHAPFWLMVVGTVLAVGLLAAIVLYATLGG